MIPTAANQPPAAPIICDACGTPNVPPVSPAPQRTMPCRGCGRVILLRVSQQSFTRAPRSEEHQ